MKDLSTDEFEHHIHKVFEDKYFRGDESFIMSKSALLDGLEHVKKVSMIVEEALEEGNKIPLPPYLLKECVQKCVYFLRQIEAVASILKVGMDGMHLKS